jgi:hypothetical protein
MVNEARPGTHESGQLVWYVVVQSTLVGGACVVEALTTAFTSRVPVARVEQPPTVGTEMTIVAQAAGSFQLATFLHLVPRPGQLWSQHRRKMLTQVSNLHLEHITESCDINLVARNQVDVVHTQLPEGHLCVLVFNYRIQITHVALIPLVAFVTLFPLVALSTTVIVT